MRLGLPTASPKIPRPRHLRDSFFCISGPIYAIMALMTISGVLPYVQIVLSLLLIAAVLFQQTGASLGGAFGGDNFSAGYHTRRGLERSLFWGTIIIAVLFVLSAFVALLVH